MHFTELGAARAPCGGPVKPGDFSPRHTVLQVMCRDASGWDTIEIFDRYNEKVRETRTASNWGGERCANSQSGTLKLKRQVDEMPVKLARGQSPTSNVQRPRSVCRNL